jgi:hypothetical protein
VGYKCEGEAHGSFLEMSTLENANLSGEAATKETTRLKKKLSPISLPKDAKLPLTARMQERGH